MLCGIVALCVIVFGIGVQVGRLIQIREDRRST